MDAFITQFRYFANRNNAIVINLLTSVDIEWSEAKKYMSKHNLRKESSINLSKIWAPSEEDEMHVEKK
jgi:hypothetical protein